MQVAASARAVRRLGSSLAILAASATGEPPRPSSAGSLRPVIEALLRRDLWARPDSTAAGEMLAAVQTAGAYRWPAWPASPAIHRASVERR